MEIIIVYSLGLVINVMVILSVSNSVNKIVLLLEIGNISYFIVS